LFKLISLSFSQRKETKKERKRAKKGLDGAFLLLSLFCTSLSLFEIEKNLKFAFKQRNFKHLKYFRGIFSSLSSQYITMSNEGRET
jgi:hypothetical protein